MRLLPPCHPTDGLVQQSPRTLLSPAAGPRPLRSLARPVAGDYGPGMTTTQEDVARGDLVTTIRSSTVKVDPGDPGAPPSKDEPAEADPPVPDAPAGPTDPPADPDEPLNPA